jgi:Tol biopolymer transport system component
MMFRAVVLLGCVGGSLAFAARLPVLKQIDLPHPYYFREMYLPQLTSGPASVTWSPDSREVIYSMAGSLWRQRLGTDTAQQLTAAAGYDYQPDWSPDGRWVAYSSYDGESVELRLLDLGSGESHALSSAGAVNLEPRFSPDGRRLLFVSTSFNRRFHIFMGDLHDGQLVNVVRVTGENRSPLPRYYYSAYDHEINPLWSRDGREIIYVSNRNHIYGTGGIWRAPASAAGEAREIHYEETNWKARPDISPDGSRLVFSSYTGRAWNNLWVMPAGGGDPLPIAFGEWDQTSPRWSPDGRSIAFIGNRGGNTELCLMPMPGGSVSCLGAPQRHYLHPMGQLHLVLANSKGGSTAARISITDAAGKFHAPAGAWIHADDGVDRSQQHFEAHYFHARGETSIDVPAGPVHVEIMRGFERKLETHDVTASAGQVTELATNLSEGTWSVPDTGHWLSADVHVHMNYGGAYRNQPAHLVLQAQAEDLGLVNALIVNKEQRFPDIAYNGAHIDPASAPDALIVHGQEFHTSYWGHLGLLDIDGAILPGYAGYPNSAASSLYPMNADIADIAHARGALVGYVHPFDEEPQPVLKPAEVLHNELPVDVALGKVDYMEIVGFSDHRATAAVWYRLLNLGFHLPAAGGTDAMANFASLRGPVGMNRVYARIPEDNGQRDDRVKLTQWLEALRQGRSFATNGPLLGFTLETAQIGDTLKFDAARQAVHYSVRLESIVPVDHLELVCNGRVVKSLVNRPALAQGEFQGTIRLNSSGWCLVRASTDTARHPVLDNYVYATTSPIYVSIAGQRARSPPDAQYFAAWIDRVSEATAAYPDWNSAAEKQGVLDRLRQARAIFAALQ